MNTFQGSNLGGWKGYVRIGGREILSAGDLAGDTFTATLPSDLSRGFYEITVDISHLVRKTFFFECV